MTSLLMLVLLIVAALAVDIGNAYVHKRERQKDSDHATLAGAGIGGSNLPAPGAGTSCSPTTEHLAYTKVGTTDQAAVDVAAHLTRQLGRTITASELTNCKVGEDGELFYGTPKVVSGKWSLTYNKNQLSLVTPPDEVDFGFAGIIGYDSTNVAGISTVEIRTPKMETLPYFALDSCSYGAQTLQQPSNGLASKELLYLKDQTNAATVSTVTPASYAVAVTPTTQLTITGNNFTNVTHVGFFEPGASGPGPAPTEVAVQAAWKTATSITIPAASLPASLFTTNAYFFIRVKIGTNWSAATFGNGNNERMTPNIIVGAPTLNCGQGSTTGNFGTLRLANSHVSGEPDQIAYNVADGLESTLAPHPNPNAPFDCNSTNSKVWPTEGTNCVQSKPGGMDAGPAWKGFVAGVGGSPAVPGLLTDVSAGTGCATNGQPATTTIRGVTINNDNLTCFFTNDTVAVGDVSSRTYAGGAVISSKIYDSPRFVSVPVFGRAFVGAEYLKVIGFRSGFITDQPNSATKLTGVTTSTNGLTTQNNGPNVDLLSVQIIFLNEAALPPPPVKAGTIAYTGIGVKVPLLVN
ncbi:hypothetical protein GCM10009843_06200 [Nocardioides bigeumensis]|uniref:Putative Flp pilus-assembly TadG-like N-terminal domain-containing protein n=2 Tax=Nocardioides bigeumensis TaxID=433657 RepID=A0ABP5JK10_9ACTN